MSDKSKRFSDLEFGKRFKELLKNADESELKRHLGVESASTFRQWTNGYTLPTSENLRKLAIYFDVSTDYLLGLTGVKSQDMELRAICEKIGLSESAVAVLVSTKDRRKKTYVIDFLEHIIEVVVESRPCEGRYLLQDYLWGYMSSHIEFIAGFELPDMTVQPDMNKAGNRYESDMEYRVPGAYHQIQQLFLGFVKTLVDESEQSERLQRYEWKDGVRVPLPPFWMKEIIDKDGDEDANNPQAR